MKNLLMSRVGKLLIVFVISLSLLVTLFSSGLQLSRAVSTAQIHPIFYGNFSGFSSTLTIQNTNPSSDTQVDLTLSGSGGTVNYSAAITTGGSVSVIPDDVPGLMSDFYAVVVDSSVTDIESVAIHKRSGTNDNLSSSRGLDLDDAGNSLIFATFTKDSALLVQNVSSSDANVTITFYNSDGTSTTVSNQVISAGSSNNFFGQVIGLPDGFIGWAEISSDQPVVGIIQTVLSNEFYEIDTPFETANDVIFPRAFKGVDQGGVTRTSQVFIANTGNSAATVNVTFASADGVVVDTDTLNLNAKAGAVIDLADRPALNSGQTYVVSANAANPLLIAEMPPANGPVVDRADYKGGTVNNGGIPTIYLPRTVKRPLNYSVINLQNPNGSDAIVLTEYFDENGQAVHSANNTIAAGGLLPINLSEVAPLGSDFSGSAVISADQPLTALVDEYQVGSSSMEETIPVTPTEGITVTTSDDILTIEADPDALPNNAVELRYRSHGITPTVSITTGLPTLNIVAAFSLELLANGGAPVTETITPPLRLSVTYSQTIIDQSGIDEANLTPLFFDTVSNAWSGADINNVTVNTDTNTSSWTVSHLTEFVIVEKAAANNIYLPIVLK